MDNLITYTLYITRVRQLLLLDDLLEPHRPLLGNRLWGFRLVIRLENCSLPPVANRSSTITTFCPSCILSFCASNTSWNQGGKYTCMATWMAVVLIVTSQPSTNMQPRRMIRLHTWRGCMLSTIQLYKSKGLCLFNPTLNAEYRLKLYSFNYLIID